MEGTYQRYVVSEKKTEEKKAGSGLIAKAQDFVEKYFMIVAAATAAVILLLLIVIIILSVKLDVYKRQPYGSAGTVFGVLDRGRGACLSTVEQTAAGLGKYNMALLLFWISFLYGRI